MEVVTDQAVESFLEKAVSYVESTNIRAWVYDPKNLLIWRQIARKALERGNDDELRFSSYIICVALG